VKPFVHTHADGQLAVIGVLIVEGAHNPAFDPDLGKPAG
jgi:carbonic anhydrase